LDKEEYLSKVERKLRRHALIATWDQTERNVTVDDVNFDLIVKGDTGKMSMGILARLLGSILLPKQKVATMVTVIEGEQPISIESLVKIINAAKQYMAKENLHWIWLVTVAFTDFLAGTLRFAEEYCERNIPIILVNLKRQKVVAFTDSNIGRSSLGFLKP
jgi:hypothetical protein